MNVDIFGSDEPVSVWVNTKLKIAFACPEYGPMKYDPEKDDWTRMDDEEWKRAMEDAQPAWTALDVERMLGL